MALRGHAQAALGRGQGKGKGMSTWEVIEKLPDHVRPSAYVVGHWVWITFESKPGKDTRETLNSSTTGNPGSERDKKGEER